MIRRFRNWRCSRRQRKVLPSVMSGKLTINQAREQLGLPPYQFDSRHEAGWTFIEGTGGE